MRAISRVGLSSFLGLSFLAGCAGAPEVLCGPGSKLGTYWELVYCEGPVMLDESREAKKDITAPAPRVAKVEVFGLERRGWGSWMPWCWFGDSTGYVYTVNFFRREATGALSPQGSGTHCYREPIPAILTSFRVAAEAPPDQLSDVPGLPKDRDAAKKQLLENRLGKRQESAPKPVVAPPKAP